jgi:uncharacterized repeat protein (TIGR01451 family)
MKKFLMIIISLCASLFIFVQCDLVYAQEEGHVELKCVAEMEVEVINEKGEKDIKRVEAARVVPGDEVIYTIFYTIKGKEIVNDIVVSNPIPAHMMYKERSASSDDTDVVFSIDGGKTFDIPGNLRLVDNEGKERQAIGADYTHIQWKFRNSIGPGKTGQVSYRAELE